MEGRKAGERWEQGGERGRDGGMEEGSEGRRERWRNGRGE